MVLLKGFDARGFTFFTNYGSAKAEDIDGSGGAALCFYWEHLGRQVRVRGAAARVPEAESEAYFASRPRGSRLGAWSSDQSSVIPSREVRAPSESRCLKTAAANSCVTVWVQSVTGFRIRLLQ